MEEQNTCDKSEASISTTKHSARIWGGPDRAPGAGAAQSETHTHTHRQKTHKNKQTTHTHTQNKTKTCGSSDTTCKHTALAIMTDL